MSISSFTNPVRWEDLPDPEVLRVGNVYYMSASSFHFSPGAPVLRSNDLVNWEYVGHSIPTLLPQDRFTLDGIGPSAYGKGVWASTLKYRKSNGLFYFYTSLQGTDKTYVSTAKSPEDTWTVHAPIERFYYDLGLLIDDNDAVYIAHGTKTIQVAELSPDGLSEVTNKIVYQSDEYLEGARMYKIKDTYYIWLTKSADTQTMLKSKVGPFGPYEAREIISQMRSPIPGAGSPHQGGLVDTPDGRWYFMSFTDAFPTGRVPVLAPVEFDDEGWLKVLGEPADDGKGIWTAQYLLPEPSRKPHFTPTCLRQHSFGGNTLECCWQWNHNPVPSKWKLEDGSLVLETATVTSSLHLAANTLTHRTIGPGSTMTVCLDVSGMKSGDRAGLSMFRDESAYIGIHKEDGGQARIAYVDGIHVGPISVPVGWLNGRPAALDWKVISNGSAKSETPFTSNRLWLRVTADMRAAHADGFETAARNSTFEYSLDGTEFTRLGPAYALTKSTHGYIGYRYAIFNFATVESGGAVRVLDCQIHVWDPSE